MSKHMFEFVVKGPPYSGNNDSSKPKTDWKQKVGVAAYNQWIAEERSNTLLPISAPIEAYVTTYCRKILYDVDNVLKWTLDGLNSNERPQLGNMNSGQKKLDSRYESIYEDDRQIYKVTSERVALLSADLRSPVRIVAEALDVYEEFLHIALIWED